MIEYKTQLERLQSLISAGGGGGMLKTMQQRVISVDNGEAVVEGTPGPQFENHMGRIHGGYLAALIDTAMGCAALSKMTGNTGLGTVDLNVKFVKRFEVSTGPVLATAKVLHAGRTMLTVECKVADAAGLLYAHGQGTFLIYPK
jgi:uncharacterized protein (TIGR00369 family)